MRRLLLLVLVMLGRSSAHAAEYIVRGVIVDEHTGRPIPRAVVRLQLQSEQLLGSGRSDFGRADIVQQVGSIVAMAIGGPGGQGPQGGPGGLRRGGNRPAEDVTAIADDAGRFQLVVPEAGRWVLSASARGYRLQRYQQHEGYSTELVLSPATASLEIRMPIREDARLTGVVTDEAGEPVRGASVTLFERRAETLEDATTISRRGATTSDDRGGYEFEQLAPGEYLVAVSATPWYVTAISQNGGRGGQTLQQTAAQAASSTGAQSSSQTAAPMVRDSRFDVAYPTVYSGGVTDAARASLSRLAAGDRAEVNLQMTPVASLHLQLTSATGTTGRAVVPAVVPLGPDGQPLSMRTRVLPGSGGMEMTGLTPGDYRVVTPSTDTGSGRGGGRGGGGRSSVTTVIHLANGASLKRSLGELGLARVNLTVTGPERPTMVVLTDETTHASYTARAEATQLDNSQPPAAGLLPAPAGTQATKDFVNMSVSVPPGRYRISLQDRRRNGVWLARVEGGAARGAVITVESETNVALTVGQGRAQVNGVAMAGLKPVPGAMVELVPAGFGSAANLSEIRRAQTGTDGSFVLRDVEPGAYIVYAMQSWEAAPPDAAGLAPRLTQGVPLILKSGETLTPKVPAQM